MAASRARLRAEEGPPDAVAGVRVVADGLGPDVVRLQRRARHHAVAAAGAAGVHLFLLSFSFFLISEILKLLNIKYRQRLT